MEIHRLKDKKYFDEQQLDKVVCIRKYYFLLENITFY
jgi:hypothetical protein